MGQMVAGTAHEQFEISYRCAYRSKRQVRSASEGKTVFQASWILLR